MPSLFSRIRGKDGHGKHKSKKDAHAAALADQSSKPRWEDAYTRSTVEPEEVQDLVRRCTAELKARALDHPFLLLPFRPTSDPSAVRTFIRHYFDDSHGLRGEPLAQELRMIEPMVISGVLKWCWSRLPGGVVGWDAYELFKVGEQDSNMARDAFTTFIPLSVENEARSGIINSFFDLMSAIAAHGKKNGFGGRKLSRMASWWTFEHKDTGDGFEGGYKSWLRAADATSHLFFAYLRAMAPQPTVGGISVLPISLQKLLQETEYPPQKPSLMQSSTNRVVMIVDTVSPTPFALLRRASHFQYRDDDKALHEFSEYEDPVMALSEECRRVLRAISSANQSQISSAKHSTGLRDASWSRFEDIGFSGTLDDDVEDEELPKVGTQAIRQGLRTTPASGATQMGRPTTPSWADFLSSGFVDESQNSASLLPPDKVLPPINAEIRQRSAQSHRPRLENNQDLEPGELASITRFDLDEAFWWVWMSSLAPEETPERKSSFGRCAVVETVIRSGKWLVMEEMVKGAAPEPDAGAYIAEKKSFFGWTRKNKGVGRRQSTGKQGADKANRSKAGVADGGASKTSIGDQHAKIHAAAQQLQARQAQEQARPVPLARRGRTDSELIKEKTNSVLTLQPVIMKEASPAMKWANKYDKDAIREAYLLNTNAGRGLGQATMQTNGHGDVYDDESDAVLSPGFSERSAEPPTPATIPERLETVEESEPSMEASREGPHGAMTTVGRDSPLPPIPTETPSVDVDRENMISPGPPSPDTRRQHKKLHKDEKKPGGFRKLFSRRNRASKVPTNAANDINIMLTHPDTPEPPVDNRVDSPFASPASHQDSITPTQTPTAAAASAESPAEPAYEPSLDESISRVDTADAAQAKHEFSRFDQGPLADQPAFIPEDDVSEENDATPPPIARHTTQSPPVTPPPEEEGAPSPAVPMSDRWAQIRKNAADRARESEEQSGGTQSKTTDDDDNTSTEETIESRVARIKARVAELTGNMEGTTAPDSRVPPYRR